MLWTQQTFCKSLIVTLLVSTISVLVLYCTGIFAFSLPIIQKKGKVQKLTKCGESSDQGRESGVSVTYKLGLTPYIPQIKTTRQKNIDESLVHSNNDLTFHTNHTIQQPLSYLHLLQHPDRELHAIAVQNGTKQMKLQKSIFIDQWMMQLPSKWAAFVSEGDNKDNYRVSNIFALPSSNNTGRSLGTKASNVSNITRSDNDTSGIGTFETSDDFNTLWDAVFNKTIVRETSQHDIVGQNKSKIVRVSTQPQSIFTNFNDPRNNATASTNALKASLSKQHYQHPLLVGKDPSAAITVADLEAILRYNNYYARPFSLSNGQELQFPDGKKSLVASSSQKLSKGGVAFPQPTALSTRSIKWGATIAGGMMGMLLAVSGEPNLWLVGIVCGSVFGYETFKKLPANDVISPDLNVVQTMVIYLGRGLATGALRVYDTLQAFFFMYKTGQLSYEYYKSYAALDKRLSIQKKIDSWNARFVEGKIAFDRWEKEVGITSDQGIVWSHSYLVVIDCI